MIPPRAAGAWGCTTRPPICSLQMLLFCRGLFVPFPQDCNGNSSPSPEDLRNWCMNPLRCLGCTYRRHPYTCRQRPCTLLDLKISSNDFFFPAKQAINSLFNLAPLLFSTVDNVLMLKVHMLTSGHLFWSQKRCQCCSTGVLSQHPPPCQQLLWRSSLQPTWSTSSSKGIHQENSGLNFFFTPCFGLESWLSLEFGCCQPLRKRDVERGAMGWTAGRAAKWELGTWGIIWHLSCPALAMAAQASGGGTVPAGIYSSVDVASGDMGHWWSGQCWGNGWTWWS